MYCGPCGFLLQSQMHAFMPAVLLRMAGLNALDRDAQAQPPDRQSRKLEQSMRGSEGHAVVGADRARQAALSEKALKGLKSQLCPVGFHRLAQQQIP